MNASALLLIALATAPAQLPASADTKPVPITGVVVDESDRPVANADVWLAEALPPEEGRRAGMELWYISLTGPCDGAPPMLVQGRSDADGRFALELPAEAVARRSPPPLAVWAASGIGQAARVAFRRLPRIVLPDDPPVRISLGPPVHASLTVLTPDRRPAAGARVVPARAGEVPIPEPIGRAHAVVTDAAGRAEIAGLEPISLGEVRVKAEGLGVQVLQIQDSRIEDSRIPRKADRSAILTLAPAGRIDGRLVAPRGEPIRGVRVRATSLVEGTIGSGVRGTATVACDEQGRFTIPAIAAGMVSLELEFDPASSPPLRGEGPKRLIVKAGRATDVTIALRETVVVRGLLREKGTERPIPGARIVLNGFFGGDHSSMTDAEGRFAGRILRDAGQPYGWPIRVPAPFYEPADMAELPQQMPRRGVAELVLPPIELRRGVDVRGIASGEDGKPVAGAEVEAIWYSPGGGAKALLARTDRAGGFVLHGIDPIAELNLTAWDGFAGTGVVTVRAAAAEERPIALSLSPRNTVPVGGQVVDAGGRPIAGAAVRLRRQVRGKDRRVILDDAVAARDGSFVQHTDADGRFRTRGRFPTRGEYYAEATAPGRLSARSSATAAEHDSGKLPDLVLRRIRTALGQVVDRQGRPVAGALVRQSGDGPMPSEALTADDGRFHLPGVLEGSAVLLVEKGGFQHSLQSIDDGSRAVEIALARSDERPAVAYRTLTAPSPVDEEKALAHRLIAPVVAKVLAGGNDDDKYVVLRDAAGIDPHAAIDWLAEARFAAPAYADYVRQFLAESVALESIDDATAILEASTDPGVRTGGYIGLVDVAPNLTAAQEREFLEQALLNCKNVSSLVHRFDGLGRIADRLIDLGDLDRARTVLRESLEQARSIGKENKSAERLPMYLAVALSRLDPPAALKIIADLEQVARKNEPGDRSRIYERYFGLIAHRLADRSPAEAEQVLGRMQIRPALDREIVAICARMAAVDIARARRIAETRISPDAPALRPHAFGLMARAIAPKDRAGAVRLLDDAFAELERLAARQSALSEPGAMVAAAALLPAVEQVEPDRLAEFLGRAVLLRFPRGDRTAPDEYAGARHTSRLAMLVARYDRGLAARILQPELDHVGAHRGNRGVGVDFVAPEALAALALIDPRRAVALVEALPNDPPSDDISDGTKYQALTSVAKLLALQGDDRWRLVYQQLLYLWTPDQRYL